MVSNTAEEQKSQRQGKFWAHAAYFDCTVSYPAPYVQFTGKPYADRDGVRYDANGFREPYPTVPKTNLDEMRIFLLGDSTIYAGDAGSDSIPDLVQRALDELMPMNIKAYNFGATSYCIDQMNALIFNRLLNCKPDMIIVVGGVTDLFQPYTFDPRPGFPYNSFMSEYIYEYFFDPNNAEMREQGLSYHQLMQYSSEMLEKLRTDTGWKTESWENAVADNIETSIGKLALLAKATKIPIVFIRQPVVVRKARQTIKEQSTASPEFLNYLSRQYDRFDKIIKKIRKQELPNEFFSIADAASVFDDVSREIFTDIVHYNNEGREIVTKMIIEQIIRMTNERRRGRITSMIAHLARRWRR